MKQNERTILIALATILGMALLSSMTSCTTSKRMVYIPKNTYDTTVVVSHNSISIFNNN